MLFLNGLVNGIIYGGLLALLAFPINLIFGVLNVLHLAYGQCVMVGLYVIYVSTYLLHIPFLLSCLIAIAVSAGLSILIHLCVVQPLMGKPALNQLIALAGVMAVLENVALGIFGGDYLGFNLNFPVFSIGEVFIKISMLIPFFCAVITLGILWYFLNKTYTGLAIKAVVQNKEVASLMGIRTQRIYLVTFAVGGVLAGLVAAFFAPIYAVHPHFGLSFTLTAFVIVVLGGLGNLLGGFIAAFIIGMVSQMGAIIFTSEIGEILVYAIFILVILFRPQGLLGVKVRTA
jgi:branched-chain amino acid transport system permease protein